MMCKASVTLNGQIQIITSEYNSKKDFAADLRRNGYKVQFVATPETFEAESDKYNERRERKNSIARYARAAEKASRERIAEQEAETTTEGQNTETSENYVAWCGMNENGVFTEEYETLSELVDDVEIMYTKEEMRAAGITFCRLLCSEKQWLECLEEKTVDDVYYF